MRVIGGFAAGMAMSPELRASPAAQASARAVKLWRDNHCTIYTVDADLQAEVIRGGLPDGTIPAQVFRRFPHAAPLFILPSPVPVPDPTAVGGTLLYDMFIAAVTRDPVIDHTTGRFLPDPQPLLRFVWFGANPVNPDEFVFTTSSIHLRGDVDLHKSLDVILTDVPAAAGSAAEVSKRIRGENWDDLNATLFPVASMLSLYACSQTPDLQPVVPPEPRGRNPKTRKAPYQLHSLGVRVGSAIRAARRPASSHTGDGTRTVAPHLRKAHWHRFWVGPRRDPEQRKLVLRWVPPVAVNTTKGAVEPTLHPLRHHKEKA
jgi:hypothetical protein